MITYRLIRFNLKKQTGNMDSRISPDEWVRLAELMSHAGSGNLCRNVAFVCGKGDDFTVCKNRISSSADVSEKSWEVLRVFYPSWQAGPKTILYESPPFISNPYGDAAIIPSDVSCDELKRYRYLIMTGWNRADADFAAKMLNYVRGGGVLLLTWAHLYTESERSRALMHQSPIFFNDDIRELTGLQGADFTAEVPVLNPPVRGSKIGMLDHRIGEGRVLLINSKCYPGERPIRRAYSALVQQIAQESRSEEYKWGWVSADRGIYTVACDAEDRRIFYLVDVRRKKAGGSRVRAVLHMGESECGFPVDRAGISVMTLFPGLGILTTEGAVEAIGFDGDAIRLSGSGWVKVVLFRWVDGEIQISERRLELCGETVEKI